MLVTTTTGNEALTRLLSDADLPSKDQRIQCPVCFCDTIFHKRVYACDLCGHRYRPLQIDPIQFHAETFRLDHGRGDGEFDAEGAVTDSFHEHREELSQRRMKRVKRFLKPTDSVLDVGGGAGDFLMAIRDQVASVHMTELSPELIAAAKRNGIDAEVKSLHEMAGRDRYDVVFAWHVVEHLEPLRPAIEVLKGLFRRYLIIEIPKERGAPERFDGHYHFFSDESLQRTFDGLVVRHYGEGLQRPARFAIFEHPRSATQALVRAKRSNSNS